MDILKLSRVPPPKTPDPGDRVAPESESPTPASPMPPAEPGFDTSALSPPSEASTTRQTADVEGDPLRTLELKPKIVEQLSTVYDPEIPVNIYELGLIYDVIVDTHGVAVIKMTLTAPGCPAAITLPAEVQSKVKSIEGVSDARVDLVWDPPWSKDRMSEAAKLQLGVFD